MEPGINRISDLSGYLCRMQKSMIDKMFFMDKVFEPFDIILDFGCANGELIKMLQMLFDEYQYIGYDLSATMISAAKAHVPQAAFYSDWDQIRVPFDRCLLNISSVIHEVYSYCGQQEIAQFWRRVFGSGFRYITIRDMMIPAACAQRPAAPEMLAQVRVSQAFEQHLADYEAVWGSIRTEKDLMHYLLKYSYTENWEREVRENYFGCSLEQLHRQIPDGYRITYQEHTLLPYIAWQVKRDFGIELKTPTHIKMILEKV